MNERIKELANQAELTIHTGRGNTYKSHPEFNKKFAELIIQECAAVAQNYVTAENNKLVETVHISPWQLQDKIKEHFGVE